MRRRAGDRVDQGLQRLLEHVHFLDRRGVKSGCDTVTLSDLPVPHYPGLVWAGLTGRTWFFSPPES